jgi:hypothetical protein
LLFAARICPHSRLKNSHDLRGDAGGDCADVPPLAAKRLKSAFQRRISIGFHPLATYERIFPQQNDANPRGKASSEHIPVGFQKRGTVARYNWILTVNSTFLTGCR